MIIINYLYNAPNLPHKRAKLIFSFQCSIGGGNSFRHRTGRAAGLFFADGSQNALRVAERHIPRNLAELNILLIPKILIFSSFFILRPFCDIAKRIP